VTPRTIPDEILGEIRGAVFELPNPLNALLQQTTPGVPDLLAILRRFRLVDAEFLSFSEAVVYRTW